MSATLTRVAGFELTATPLSGTPLFGKTAWDVEVKNPRGRKYRTPFYLGEAHTGQPTVEQVLGALVSDAQTYRDAADFEDWAANMGYSWETRSERRVLVRMYMDVHQLAMKAETFLTEEEADYFWEAK